MAQWYKPGKIKIAPGQNLGEGNDDTVDQLAYDPSFLSNPGGHAESGPGPEPERSSPEWPAWKAHARAWRKSIGERQNYVDMQLSMGASLEDLGIRDVHEEGKAGYNRIMNTMSKQGNLNRGYEYDLQSGMKKNMATSDVTVRGKWVAMTPQEKQEVAYQKTYGNHPGAYIDRLRSEQQSRFGNVMKEGGPQDAIKKNASGVYEDKRPDGSTVFYDDYGAKTDAQGNRIGGSYHHDGKGTFTSNRVAASTDQVGHASTNGTSQNQAFNPITGSGGGYTNQANMNPQQTPQVNPVTGGPLQTPQFDASHGNTPYERNRQIVKQKTRGYQNSWT